MIYNSKQLRSRLSKHLKKTKTVNLESLMHWLIYPKKLPNFYARCQSREIYNEVGYNEIQKKKKLDIMYKTVGW